MKNHALSVALILVVCLVPNPAPAKTWRVYPDGSGDAPTIQAGIDSANTSDVVLLAPGIYTGAGNRDIAFKGKAITVQSSGGAAGTTIDCQSAGRAFVFTAGEGTSSVLAGVRIVNGTHALFGGAVYCVNSSPTIENSIFFGNGAGFRGGAICADTSSAVLTGNVFEENDASYGGAVSCAGSSSLVVTDNDFLNNTAVISGGAVAVRSSAPTIQNNRFAGNSATNEGGAVYCDQVATPLISNNAFRENSAAGNGGAIGLLQSSPTIEYNLFRQNQADLGGGVFCNNFSNGEIRNNTFDENSAGSGTGAAVYCTNFSAPPISNNVVVNSTTGNAFDTKNDSVPTISCCCVFNNAGGDGFPQGAIDGGGNFSQDPEFCGIDGSGNYYLQSDSPCAPGQTAALKQCGQIGAFGVLCSTTDAEEKTWGAVKAMYQD